MILRTIVIGLLLALLAVKCVAFTMSIRQMLEERIAEGECITSYIVTGIERSDIVAKDGICFVKGGK